MKKILIALTAFPLLLLSSGVGAIDTVLDGLAVSGSAGIGISSPIAQLHARGTLSGALTGTVSVTFGTAAVTGEGTAFDTALAVGDSIKIVDEIFTVSAIGSATTLTLDSNHVAGASAVTAYSDSDLFRVDNGDAVEKFSIDKSGIVGLAQVTAPTTTTNKLYNVAGALTWNGTDLTAAIASDQIIEGDTKVEAIDTGSDGNIIFETDGVRRMALDNTGILDFATDSYVGITDQLAIPASDYSFTVGTRGNNEATRAAEIEFKQTTGSVGSIIFRAYEAGGQWADDSLIITYDAITSIEPIYAPSFYVPGGNATSLTEGIVHLASSTDNYVRFTDDGSAFRGIIGFANGSGALVYRSGATNMSDGTERFRIASTGYTGIGTASPSGILDVAGGTAATDTAGTNITFLAQAGGTDGGSASTGQAGGDISVTSGGGSAAVTTNADGGAGGDILLTPGSGGAGDGTGAAGSAGAVVIAQTTAPSTTTDKLYNDAGSLYWNGTELTASGVSGAVQFSDGAGGFSSDNTNYHWDDTNDRLGVGIAVPLSTLHVNGGTGTLDTGLTFGDGDTGFYEISANSLGFAASGSLAWRTNGSTFIFGANSYYAAMYLTRIASATSPNIAPSDVDGNTGLGRAGADQLSLVAGAVEGQRISEGNSRVSTVLSGTVVETITDGSTTAAAATLTKAAENFLTTVNVGDAVVFYGGSTAADYGTYIVTSVNSDTQITVDRNISVTNTDVDFDIISKGVVVENSVQDGVANIHSNKLILDEAKTYGNTTGLFFGDGDSGIYETADDIIVIDAPTLNAPNTIQGGQLGNEALTVRSSTALSLSGDQNIVIKVKDARASGDFITMSSVNSGGALTSSSTEQSYFSIAPQINQSATGAYNGLKIDVTETAVGDGSTGDGNNILNLAVGGASKFVVDNGGNVGIGTSSPGTTLEVDGTVAFTPSATTDVTAVGGLTVTKGLMRVAGDAAAIDITADPQIVDGVDGQIVIIQGDSDTNTLKFDDGTGLALSGAVSFTMGKGDMLQLAYDLGDDLWYEITRSDN